MRGVFDEEESEQAPPERATELTLGLGMLLLLFLGLVLVCGLCFGLGYAVGRRGTQPAMAAGQQSGGGAGTPLQANGSAPKPAATAQAAVPPPAQNAPSQGDGSQAASSVPQPVPAVVVPVPAQPALNPAAPPSGHPQVRPALPPAAPPPAISASRAHPVLPPAVPLMVQIAAVSQQEDADVLTGALRKRGYAVSARRDPTDNLIHVHIGPFHNRDEADRWRIKLLADGYNAMIRP